MAKQSVNIGTTANDGTGSPLRTAFDFINDNTDELYNLLGDGSTLSISGDVTMSAGAVTIAADAIDGSNIADDSIDSEHYVDESIDTAHFSLTAAINTVTDQNSGTLKLWSGSQAAYDALTPDASTIYFIV